MQAAPSPQAGSRLSAPLPPRVVFFDGVCGLCDRTVQRLLSHDPEGRFHFATLQGATAAELRSAYPDRFPTDIDTLVYLDNSGAEPRILLRSEASFAIARELDGLRAWAWLGVLPRPVTDLGYRLLAAVRYRIFGRLDECRIPHASDRQRFLD